VVRLAPKSRQRAATDRRRARSGRGRFHAAGFCAQRPQLRGVQKPEDRDILVGTESEHDGEGFRRLRERFADRCSGVLPTADATRWSPGHITTTVAPIFTRP
jgi:hypothetical protein